jgi:hypothetical protein
VVNNSYWTPEISNNDFVIGALAKRQIKHIEDVWAQLTIKLFSDRLWSLFEAGLAS